MAAVVFLTTGLEGLAGTGVLPVVAALEADTVNSTLAAVAASVATSAVSIRRSRDLRMVTPVVTGDPS
jgi:hypothetical protein